MRLERVYCRKNGINSFPILEFVQRNHEKDDATPEYTERVREFMNVVDKSMQKFILKRLKIRRFKLFVTRFDSDLSWMI